MSSQTFLCNLALANVASPAIQSIDGSEAGAIACKLFYDHVLRVLLQSYPWRFARKTEAMAALATNPKPNKWLFAYTRPADCLKILMLTDSGMADYLPDLGDGATVQGGFAYEIEGDVIYCNVDLAYLVFTQRDPDPSLYSPMFEEAFGWHLAVRLAMPLTRDPKVRADAWQLAMKTTAEAAAMDANEVRESSDTASDAVEARTN
jgi:hypothetical protein